MNNGDHWDQMVSNVENGLKEIFGGPPKEIKEIFGGPPKEIIGDTLSES